MTYLDFLIFVLIWNVILKYVVLSHHNIPTANIPTHLIPKLKFTTPLNPTDTEKF